VTGWAGEGMPQCEVGAKGVRSVERRFFEVVGGRLWRAGGTDVGVVAIQGGVGIEQLGTFAWVAVRNGGAKGALMGLACWRHH